MLVKIDGITTKVSGDPKSPNTFASVASDAIFSIAKRGGLDDLFDFSRRRPSVDDNSVRYIRTGRNYECERLVTMLSDDESYRAMNNEYMSVFLSVLYHIRDEPELAKTEALYTIAIGDTAAETVSRSPQEAVASYFGKVVREDNHVRTLKYFSQSLKVVLNNVTSRGVLSHWKGRLPVSMGDSVCNINVDCYAYVRFLEL